MATKKIDAGDALAQQLAYLRWPIPVREYRFAALHLCAGKGLRARLKAARMQDWRFDLAWPTLRLAIEVDGGGWVSGRHSRGAGIESDCAKLSTAVSMGWRVLRVTPRQVKDGRAVAWLEPLIGVRDESALHETLMTYG